MAGPDVRATAVQRSMAATGIPTAYIEPGQPWQNAAMESFTSRTYDECPNQGWLRSRAEAQLVVAQHRREHDEARPHSNPG